MDPSKFLKESFNSSEVIAKIDFIKKKIPGRKLSESEIDRLISNGNICRDWQQITVAENFIPDNIYQCNFSGSIYLGVFSKELTLDKTIPWKAGLYNSTIINCVIRDEVVIKDINLLANYYVDSGSLLLHCNQISCDDSATYAIGSQLVVANETGGREVPTFPEMTIDFARQVATNREPKFLENLNQQIDEYKRKTKSTLGYIGKNVMIKNTSSIYNTFLGENAKIKNALAMENSLLLSSPVEQTVVSDGAWIRNSILQWGAQVDTMAIIDHSFLCEHSHAERHAKITQSIIGPNTGIAEGEVTSCLCGPFIGFHHQALLIAAFWPEGKGNVGYGANVGSNHTSKAPDQEIWPGEGLFFGLGVNIKFPANFQQSPYSIISTGVCTLPQKVAFPFSLINSPSTLFEGISPAFNELMPGWVLINNMYMLIRNEGKYRDRDKAKRNKIDYRIFRRDIIDLMIDARKRLTVKQEKSFYLENDIPGLGKNFMTDQSRRIGIEAYTFFIKYYALNLLKNKCEQFIKLDQLINDFPVDENDAEYCYARNLILKELPELSLKDCLLRLKEIQQQIAQSVEKSKSKDDKRCIRIIDDYEKVYKLAKESELVVQTWKITQKMLDEIDMILNKLTVRNIR